MDNEKFVVLRKWAEPEIRVYTNLSEIGIEIESQAYLMNLVEQITNIPLIMTKTQLLNKLREAHENLVSSMKQTTVHVV